MYLDACKRGELDLMKLAFANGADRYLHDDEGYTALHHAVRFSYDRVFDWLLETGAYKTFLCSQRPAFSKAIFSDFILVLIKR